MAEPEARALQVLQQQGAQAVGPLAALEGPPAAQGRRLACLRQAAPPLHVGLQQTRGFLWPSVNDGSQTDLVTHFKGRAGAVLVGRQSATSLHCA